MAQYKPYEAKSFLELMNICYRMGWYSGVVPLMTVTMRGGFELGPGASDTWNCDFIVELAEVKARADQGIVDVIYYGSLEGQKPSLEEFDRGNSLPGGKFRGSTLEEACSKAVLAIERFRHGED